VPRSQPSAAAWHQALGYAICGRRLSEFGQQDEPDLDELVRILSQQTELVAEMQARRRGGDWPHPVPNDLMAGLGWAQFSAALTALISRLDLAPGSTMRGPSSRPPDADERRLLHDAPPHHVG
jgi:hypothetical protein